MITIKRKIIIVVFILIAILGAVLTLPFKRNINKKVDGIEWRMADKEYSEKVSIIINGRYSNYLLKEDVFNGSISIDKYDDINELELMEVVFNDGIGDLTYFNIQEDGMPTMISFGFIICESDFSELIIGIKEPLDNGSKSWSEENGLVISTPSKNRNEAVEVYKKLVNKSEWLSQSNYKAKS